MYQVKSKMCAFKVLSNVEWKIWIPFQIDVIVVSLVVSESNILYLVWKIWCLHSLRISIWWVIIAISRNSIKHGWSHIKVINHATYFREMFYNTDVYALSFLSRPPVLSSTSWRLPQSWHSAPDVEGSFSHGKTHTWQSEIITQKVAMKYLTFSYNIFLQVVTKDLARPELSAVCYYQIENVALCSAALSSLTSVLQSLVQAAIRDVFAQHTFSHILQHRRRIGEQIQKTLDSVTCRWGIRVERTDM